MPATPVTPAAIRALGIVLGVLALGFVLVLAVALPRLAGDAGTPEPPATLPGGWTAADALTVDDVPEVEGQEPEEVVERLQETRDHVEEVYDEVYDEAPQFRAYADEDFQGFATVTVFEGDGSSFAPPNGVVDPEALGLRHPPVELVREDDTLCSVSYQATSADQEPTAGADEPVSTTCQREVDGHAVQLTTQGVSVDDTVALFDDLAAELS